MIKYHDTSRWARTYIRIYMLPCKLHEVVRVLTDQSFIKKRWENFRRNTNKLHSSAPCQRCEGAAISAKWFVRSMAISNRFVRNYITAFDWSHFPIWCIEWICVYCHYGDVIIGAISFQITSIMIVYSTVYSGADHTKNTKAPRHWPLCGEFTGLRWIPRKNVQ